MFEQNQTTNVSLDQNIRSDCYLYIFTVFTPSYNRAYCLHRVYESLQVQTFRDFEWLIVDDGSQDNTRELVENWQQAAEFPIRYIYQQNGGKNSVCNLAVQLAKGELFLTLDSDDRCMPNALERLHYHWDNIPADRKQLFSAVTALCEDQYGNLQGQKFPKDVIDANWLDLHYRYKVGGEKWGFQRTDVMKEFPFQVMPGQHIDEGSVWTQIALKYQTRFVNEILRVYYLGNEGKDQLTHQDPFSRSPGMLESRKYALNNEIKWLRYAPLWFLRDATHYNRFGFHIQNSLKEPLLWRIRTQVAAIDSIAGKLLVSIAMPLGWLVYLKDRYKISKSLRSGAK
jgi:glycosyltransferase involved in cell wall biosynthesis